MTIKKELLSALVKINDRHKAIRVLDDKTDAQLRELIAALTEAVIKILDKIEEKECDV